MSEDLIKVSMDDYQKNPNRYVLREGSESGAPLCPYGNHYEWIGYDLEDHRYVRFTKSVFKVLVKQFDKNQDINE